MIFVRILEILVPLVLLVGGLGYGCYRVLRWLDSRRGLPAGADPELVATMERARAITQRIRHMLPEGAGGGGDHLSGELEELIQTRLPAALERQHRLLEHLGRRDRDQLAREERELARKASATGDPELKALHDRNLALIRGRIEAYDKLVLAGRKADAYIRSLLLNLEAFEDRLAASTLGKVDTADRRIGELISDVKLLEAAYDDLEVE